MAKPSAKPSETAPTTPKWDPKSLGPRDWPPRGGVDSSGIAPQTTWGDNSSTSFFGGKICGCIAWRSRIRLSTMILEIVLTVCAAAAPSQCHDERFKMVEPDISPLCSARWAWRSFRTSLMEGSSTGMARHCLEL